MSSPAELLDLLHLFSPNSKCSSHHLPFHRLALFGPCPPSTPIHLALSAAQGKSANVNNEEQPKDSGRRHVLLLCSSRAKLFEGLVLENEEYLAVQSGDPTIARLLHENVDMRFLDTMARWTFFCSTVSWDEKSHVESYSKALRLRHKPDLVILSGLSEFLSESRNSGVGVETYAGLVARTLSTFPTETRFIFFDDPSEDFISLPLLPRQLRSKIAQVQGNKTVPNTSPDKSTSGAVATGPEPRSMELQRIMEYFCDGVGDITAEGGSDDVLWYRLHIRSTLQDVPEEREAGGQEWGDLDKRYAVYKGYDTVGYSGRERWTVQFN